MAWRIWVDTGGTFTDGVGVAPDGSVRRVKILSTAALRGALVRRLAPGTYETRESWAAPAGLIDGFRFRLLGRERPDAVVRHYDPETRVLVLSVDPARDAAGLAFEVLSPEEAPVLAARLLTGTPGDAPLPECELRLATTLGTNALLQRRGVPTALFVTRGFRDLARIGDQTRPDLFRLDVVRPEPLHQAVVEVEERLAADGSVVRPLDIDALEPRVLELLASGVRAAAVALVHGYANPAHERKLGERLSEWGFEQVSCSSELAPRIKLLPRLETAVVDAYLAPVVGRYLERVAGTVGGRSGSAMLVMTSAGGLLDPGRYRPKDSLLSGPAGGVVGAAFSALRCGRRRVIGFDMGGTSTDVARYDGDYEYVFEHRVGDARLAAPALAIESVAAGGGSVCWLDGERLRVGPQSAGADPGPACYGAGGPLTLTDLNLLAGRLDTGRFEIPIDAAPAHARLEQLRLELERQTGEAAASDALIEGLQAVADETMADAIRRISLRRGYDPADYSLVAFGGAGAQHACHVAERLGIREVLVPPHAALLSALGLGHAVVERFVERQVLRRIDDVLPRLETWFDELAAEARDAVAGAGIEEAEVELRRRILHMRFAGQESTLEVDWLPELDLRQAFEQRFAELYGHRPQQRDVELESMRVIASSRAATPEIETATPPVRPAEAEEGREALLGGRRRAVSCYDRDRLPPGAALEGPALVFERRSASVVPAGWSGSVGRDGTLILEAGPESARDLLAAQPEAIRLELFTQRFTGIVRQMGERLERTAVSTNVKERLDFSCALLDGNGDLVVNAPHIPVHLGALGLCVRRLRETLDLEQGDVAVTNHPGFGGSHLPDVTVVTPLFSSADPTRPIAYLASRAHHAEIGGTRPGSMPPAASRLAEEGVVISPTWLLRRGEPRWEEIASLLTGGPYPSRNPADNLADLRAAAAANHAGAEALRALARSHGEETLLRYMERLQELAERRIREALSAIPDGSYSATERLDDGTPIAVRIELAGDGARIDFTGSGGVHPGNLNATPAVVQSAVIYVLRLLLREPLPLNEGLLRAVDIVLPKGLLNPDFPRDPRKAPAVVGGNVETSQRLVDTLLRALELAACSQGTMNNLIFGNERYGYYETVGGGSGAGPGFHGADGVHTHMTNTRITDVEILEHRYPVRVERFGLRNGSGGEGMFRGGDGIVRELLFLEPASLSILSQHRVQAPYGLQGGADGRRGEQRIVRQGGGIETLESVDGCEVRAGDRLLLETPGGGGYGKAD